MKEKNKKNLTQTDPYRFDLTGDFIVDGHRKISAGKDRMKTEARIKKENSR